MLLRASLTALSRPIELWANDTRVERCWCSSLGSTSDAETQPRALLLSETAYAPCNR